MMHLHLMVITSLILVSCSRINTQSRDYYNEKHVRHGIYPISPALSKKLTEASLQRGKELYQKHCLDCHGEKGLGDGPLSINMKPAPANLHKLVKEVPHFKFYMSVSQWQGSMPGWKEPFNEIDREDLAAYISTFK